MSPTLSILIPSLEERAQKLAYIRGKLTAQAEGKPVEILVDVDNRKATVGRKRQRLLERARGKYVVFVDDDDEVSDQYVDKILDATQSNPDVISIMVEYTNGMLTVPVFYSMHYRKDKNHSDAFERIPNHLCPVKRGAALRAGFKDMRYGEDADYAKRLKRQLKTEVIVPSILYYYLDYPKQINRRR